MNAMTVGIAPPTNAAAQAAREAGNAPNSVLAAAQVRGLSDAL